MEGRRNYLLFPFSILYGIITGFRNFLYDLGILPSKEFSIPVICVGNITAGGTGKTPHTEYLVRLLRSEFRIAVLSRGYMRRSDGFRIASSKSVAEEIGDEPLQIFRKFPDIIVATDADRVNGIKTILKEYPLTDVIILDDGFQHRRVRPGLSILLTDFHRLITNDSLLPFGRLRESPKGIKRAGIILVTKTPESLPDEIKKNLREALALSPVQDLFFTTTTYADPVPLFKSDQSGNLFPEEKNRDSCGAVVVTGIASPRPFLRYLEKYFGEINHIDFPDHHYFTPKDI